MGFNWAFKGLIKITVEERKHAESYTLLRMLTKSYTLLRMFTSSLIERRRRTLLSVK
jgi:hypothetical protein